MKRLINFIDKNLLLKIASLNSLAVVTRVLVGFLTSKAIAYYLGPGGMVLVGNLRDFINSTKSFATLGLYNGIVKYVAEFKEDTLKLSKTVSTVLVSALVITIGISSFIFFYSDNLSLQLFDIEYKYSFVFKILALALPFYTINLILLAVLNGNSRFEFLLKVSILGQILAGFITLLLIWKFSVEGAMIAIVLAEISLFIIILIGLRKDYNSLSAIKLKNFSVGVLKNMSAYSIMALFSAALLPLAFVYIRNYISDNIGVDEAGYWEAMNRISKYYLMFISSLLTLYILPKFSEISTAWAFREEVFRFYKQIMPIFALGLIGIYFFRTYIIYFVFTEEFYEVESLFFWQLLGDLIKVLSLVISYQLLAKKMLWPYLITEALSITILIVSSIYFIDLYGVRGATIAHFVTYVCYFIAMLICFKKDLFGKDYSFK